MKSPKNSDNKKNIKTPNALAKELEKIEHRAVFPDISATASSGECTGLIPSMPKEKDEYSSYQELYSMEIPKQGEK